MSSAIGIRIHHVKSITVKFKEVDGTKWMDFTFTDSHGGRHEVTAFVDKPLAIEGAEFLNFVAEHEDIPA